MKKQEKMQKTKELVEQGKNASEIARILNCSVSGISKYMDEMGIRPKRPESMRVKIMRLHNLGLTNSQIAYELEVPHSYVLATLRDNGYGRHYSKTEDNLINENTVYAVDRRKNLVLEKVVVDGVNYVDITELIFLQE